MYYTRCTPGACNWTESPFLQTEDRSSLLASHIGETAIVTKDTINRAVNRGCTMLVDEPYQLASASKNDFGKEVLETIMMTT